MVHGKLRRKRITLTKAPKYFQIINSTKIDEITQNVGFHVLNELDNYGYYMLVMLLWAEKL